MVGTQHFNLRWNNHTTNILQVFLEHLSSESLVDVTLSSEGKFIRAHKIILSACSPYFQEVFANHTDKNPLIILNGIKFEDLQSMIKFMYNGEIRVQETQLEALLAAAETLQIKGLSNVRSKYERGEITSLTPATQKIIGKNSDPPPLTEESPPVHSLKATVSLFSPTAATTRAPNTIAKALAIATPAPSISTRVKPISANTLTRISSSGSNKNINIAPRPPAAPVPALAIATIVPTVSRDATVLPTVSRKQTILPRVGAVNSIRSVVPILPRPATSKSSTKSSTSSLTLSALSATPSGTTTMTSSVIPITFTTPSINLMSSGSVRGSKVKLLDSIKIAKKMETKIGKTNFLKTLLKANCEPVTEITRVSSGNNEQSDDSTITKVENDTEKKSMEAEAPRVRKRRKTSHIVNELARETVFTSHGTVLLEPDEAVLKKMNKNLITIRTDLSDSTEIEEITMPSESKKLMIKIQSKHPQESLLIKDKKEPTKIPRPPNAFMIFANEWRRKLAVEYPTESNTSISVKLGIMWKGLSIKSKEIYYRLAKKADEEHKAKYPGYFYSPKEARIRKSLKHARLSAKNSAESSKSPSELQNFEEVELISDYMNDEETINKEEPYSAESDDDDDYTYEEEGEEDYEYEEEDDVILEYSADEEEDVKPDVSILEANITEETILPS